MEEESFTMNFVNGTAFLNHYFVKLGWLGSWIELTKGDKQKDIFTLLEKNLNTYSIANNGLKLSVPMAYIEGVKAG